LFETNSNPKAAAGWGVAKLWEGHRVSSSGGNWKKKKKPLRPGVQEYEVRCPQVEAEG